MHYTISEDPPRVRLGVHDIDEREHNLKCEYALLSEHFFYSGAQPIALPEHLLALVPRRREYRSHKNAPYLKPFLEWLAGLGLRPNRLYGKPQLMQLPSVQGLSIGPRPQRH